MTTMRLKLLLAFLSLLLYTPAAHATKYWVAETGGTTTVNCATASGESDPGFYIRTVTAGVACFGGVGGHTLIIKSGTYEEDFDQDSAGIAIPSGTSSSQRTIIQRHENDTVVFDCPGSIFNGDHQCIHINGRSNITLDGLTFDCSGIGGVCFLTQGTTNVTFQNGRIIEGGSHGSSVVGNQGGGATNTNFRFINSELHGADDSDVNGLYLSRCNSCIIEHSWFRNHGRQGIQIHFETATSTMNDMIIRYNLIENNRARCFYASTVLNLEFYGNVCRNNGEVGNPLLGSNATIMLGGHRSPYTGKVYNNTIYANNVTSGGTGCIAVSSGFTLTARNNLCLDNLAAGVSANGISAISTGSLTASNNLSTTDETLLEGASSGRFTPKVSASSLVNAGSSTGLPAGFGTVGAAPDIGAIEACVYNSAATTSTTTIRVTLSCPAQAINDGVGLRGGAVSQFAVIEGVTAKTEDLLALVQTVSFDVGVTAGMAGTPTAITIAFTRSGTNSFTDNLSIGGLYSPLYGEIASFTAQSVTNNIDGGPPVPTLAVAHFQCLDIYSTLAASVLRGDEDDDCTSRPGGYFALAIVIEATDANPDPITFKVYYNRNGGAYSALTNVASTTTPGFGVHIASGLMDGQTTTAALITNPHATFVNGSVLGQEQTAPTADLAEDSSTMMIILGVFDRATAVGDRFCFQPRQLDGTELDDGEEPCVTIVKHAAGFGS
jgi:hypothetical protein